MDDYDHVLCMRLSTIHALLINGRFILLLILTSLCLWITQIDIGSGNVLKVSCL